MGDRDRELRRQAEAQCRRAQADRDALRREVDAARRAARALLHEHHIADFIYHVRSYAMDDGTDWEGDSWDHPSVRSYSDAIEVLESFAAGGDDDV